MKQIFLILFIFCYTSKLAVFSQALFQRDIRDKEALEIGYIIDCIKANQNVDSLFEWKLYSKDEDMTSYRYKRGRLAFFTLHKNSKGEFLKSIVYYRQSFQKEIFLDDTLTKYEINSQTRFRVWMSKDSPSIYFCMINPDNVIIWVLSSGYSVYTSEHRLSE